MSLYAVKVSVNVLNRCIDSALIYDTKTGKETLMRQMTIKRRLKEDSSYIANMKINSDGTIKVLGVHGNSSYYSRKLNKTSLEYRYLVAVECNGDIIHFVCCGENDEVKDGAFRLEEIAYELGMDTKKLKFANADFRIIDSRHYTFKMINFETLQVERTACSEETMQAIEIRKHLSQCNDLDIDLNDGKATLNVCYDGVDTAYIPDSIRSIGYVSGVKTVVAGKNTEEVLDYSMWEDDTIHNFDFNGKVKTIGDCAFKDSTIASVYHMDEVEYIGNEAFSESLLTGKISLGAKIIGNKAFYYTGIKSAKLNGTKVVGKAAFKYGYNLKEVDLGSDLEYIDDFAFANTDIKEVKVPETCKKIGENAFKGCNRLKVAYIHESTEVADSAFGKKCRIVRYS